MKHARFNFAETVLFENADYVVLNKPPHISTLEDRNDPINILAEARVVIPDAQVCHRLDKDTSGVLAIARHPEAYRHLSMQFEHRQVTKIYHAVADGLHSFQNEEVDRAILKQNDGTVKIAREGKEAQTFFTTLKTFKAHTLVECRPVTGRMHQIRIHLATLGASITGDLMYGGKYAYLSALKRGFKLKDATEEEPLMKRMALHAFSLQFEGLDGKKIEVQAPYPKDFRALINQLQNNLR
ncbi:MAG: RluA family pseudouridine synthase [Bacteroidota bacterium]